MVFKKKLYKMAPPQEQQTVERQLTKRKAEKIKVNAASNERFFRRQLAQGLNGTHLGLWLLSPFYLKLGAWDLLQSWLGADPIQMRMGLQMVQEAALCSNRLRPKNTLCHQGFALANGLSFLATDKQIHLLSNEITIAQSRGFQQCLAKKRLHLGHYGSATILAFDPHRIPTYSRRIMPKKKKKPEMKTQKMLQTFFCNDALSGQPLGFTIASPGVSCTKASIELVEWLEKIPISSALLLADTEHYTVELLTLIKEHPRFDIIVPAPDHQRIRSLYDQLDFQEHWPGYALATTDFRFIDSDQSFLLIVQRTGLKQEDLHFKPFVSTSDLEAFVQVNQYFPKRWTIEEFFNFDGSMAWSRASTFNLNIRYAKQSAALLAQAACFEFKKLLPKPFKQWTAEHFAIPRLRDFCSIGMLLSKLETIPSSSLFIKWMKSWD
jgi:Transposase DDE domain